MDYPVRIWIVCNWFFRLDIQSEYSQGKIAKQREVFETGDDYLKCIYDKVLTLVTCSYEWSGARNIVLAVPVSGAVWSQKCS